MTNTFPTVATEASPSISDPGSAAIPVGNASSGREWFTLPTIRKYWRYVMSGVLIIGLLTGLVVLAAHDSKNQDVVVTGQVLAVMISVINIVLVLIAWSKGGPKTVFHTSISPVWSAVLSLVAVVLGLLNWEELWSWEHSLPAGMFIAATIALFALVLL